MVKRYAVQRTIGASPQRIWALLTDVERYPQWNPAVISLDGRIADGEKIELLSAVNPKRKFSLAVSNVEPERGMTWSDGMPMGLFRGVRTFTLRSQGDGQTEFTMEEVYSGALAPLITKTIPDMNDSFDQFAAGLKNASESAPS